MDIRSSKAVVFKTVSRTVLATQGVTAISTKLIEGLAQKMTGQSSGGISLTSDETSLDIRVGIIVQYGSHVHEVGRELQRNVRETMESLTGLVIRAVHVDVEGIIIPRV
ncbi:Asp23/Gls24 family envelope stress response protein [Paenibacillus massiliensis]|uniref:Asp23/Gls24 family envelope stress response protein n=1 Tax=Paenibacillus massiliensis TaxID=225917 RepID=UPI0004768D7D|nr:Asp23/Gls24 family envelope stress response protein [Paenibacillus massiliensis]